MITKWYVSLVKDLIGYYLEFEADSRETVQMYLQEEYYQNKVWKLPWCSIFAAQEFEQQRFHRISIPAKCGPLTKDMFVYEEGEIQ